MFCVSIFSLALEQSTVSVPEDIPPVVPQTKDEITPIVSRAVDIFWNSRRYGESLDGVQPPPDFLSDWEGEELRESMSGDQLTAQSRRSWKHMLFDLTGEIIRDIYQDENKVKLGRPLGSLPHSIPSGIFIKMRIR